MSKTIAALYPNRTIAEKVVSDLTRLGVPADRINVMSHQALESRAGEVHPTTDPDSMSAAGGAMAGAVGGAIGGVAASLALAAIPGIGWVLAAGPIASVLTTGAIGAGVGALGGGIAGAFTDAGVTAADADIYAEALRRGGSLILLTVSDNNATRVENVLDRHDPIDVDRTVARWRKEGWSGYNAKSEAFSDDKANAERRHFATNAKREVETLQAIDENVSIRKVDTAGGAGVRVRSYVVDHEVEEELHLVDESVDVDRKSVNKPLSATAAEAAFAEGGKVVEMHERHEQATIDKTARVVEQVEVAKTRTERDQTVRAVERSKKIEVDETHRND